MITLIMFLFLNIYNSNKDKEISLDASLKTSCRSMEFLNYYHSSQDYMKNHPLKNLVHIIPQSYNKENHNLNALKYLQSNNMIILRYFPAEFSKKTKEVFQKIYPNKNHDDNNVFLNFILARHSLGKPIESNSKVFKQALEGQRGIILAKNIAKKNKEEFVLNNNFALILTAMLNQSLKNSNYKIFLIGDINLEKDKENQEKNTLEKILYDLRYNLKYMKQESYVLYNFLKLLFFAPKKK